MQLLFKQIGKLEKQIESLLDDIEHAALLFKAAIADYLEKRISEFNARLEQISDLESKMDEQRRDIRYKLYSRMLIPDSRGDVLSLLENIDNIIDLTKEVLMQFSIEQPSIPAELHTKFLKLTEASIEAMLNTVLASRVYFRELHLINDYINRTFFFEHEADAIESAIKKEIFGLKDCGLAEKMQLRDFTEHIAGVSDESEAVCERLSVAAVKRNI